MPMLLVVYLQNDPFIGAYFLVQDAICRDRVCHPFDYVEALTRRTALGLGRSELLSVGHASMPMRWDVLQ